MLFSPTTSLSVALGTDPGIALIVASIFAASLFASSRKRKVYDEAGVAYTKGQQKVDMWLMYPAFLLAVVALTFAAASSFGLLLAGAVLLSTGFFIVRLAPLLSVVVAVAYLAACRRYADKRKPTVKSA